MTNKIIDGKFRGPSKNPPTDNNEPIQILGHSRDSCLSYYIGSSFGTVEKLTSDQFTRENVEGLLGGKEGWLINKFPTSRFIKVWNSETNKCEEQKFVTDWNLTDFRHWVQREAYRIGIYVIEDSVVDS